MSDDFDIDFGVLVGKTIETIDHDNETMTFVCTDGSAFRAYHMQDCCEHVGIHDISGDLSKITGSEVVFASVEVSNEWPVDFAKGECVDSFTWTTHTIRTASDVVVIRWLGESNGYYSENVYFSRTHKPIALDETE